MDPAPHDATTTLANKHGIAANDAPELPEPPAVIVVAVKPDIVEKLLPELEPMIGEGTVILSIAAGRRLESLSRQLPAGTALVRAMPNTPASVGRGMTVAIANADVTAEQKRECDALLSAVLVKLFADRQITVPANLIPYLVSRMPRSIGAARAIVAALDAKALAAGRPITRALAAEVVEGLA